jgi:hypothetical protein
MEEGDIIAVEDGAFAGYEGVIVRFTDTHVTLRVSIFGRETEVELRRDQVEDPEHDPRTRVLDGLLVTIDRRWEALEQAWWEAHEAATWAEFLTWRDSSHAARNAARSELLTTFSRHFGDDAVADMSRAELRAALDALPDPLLVHRRWWADHVAEIQARMDEDPEYDQTRRRALTRTREARHTAYQDDFRARHELDADQARERRDEAMARAMARFEEIKPAFEAAFGLTLPEQTARFWAFWTSLNEVERQAAEWIWRYPAGIMDWYEEGFESRELHEGLDHRLHFRYRPAAPEFVCVMTGDSDGLNYGLVYDDPAKDPAWVAAFYARDDPSHSIRGRTILEAYRDVIERHEAEALQYPDPGLSEEERREHAARREELRQALMHFETADRPERGQDYEDTYGVWEQTRHRAPTLDGLGAQAPGPVALTGRPQYEYDLHEMYKDARQRDAWIAEARVGLASKDPWPALVVGRDLFFKSWEAELQPTAVELLTEAYEMLGRGALAEIVRLHHEHRDLRSVDVYQR